MLAYMFKGFSKLFGWRNGKQISKSNFKSRAVLSYLSTLTGLFGFTFKTYTWQNLNVRQFMPCTCT